MHSQPCDNNYLFPQSLFNDKSQIGMFHHFFLPTPSHANVFMTWTFFHDMFHNFFPDAKFNSEKKCQIESTAKVYSRKQSLKYFSFFFKGWSPGVALQSISLVHDVICNLIGSFQNFIQILNWTNQIVDDVIMNQWNTSKSEIGGSSLTWHIDTFHLE